MPAWEKVFVDKQTELGTDEDISKGLASWSNGRLDGIASCRLWGFMCVVELVLPDTEWHQFDKMFVPVYQGTMPPRRTHRVLQAQIKQDHVGKFLLITRTGHFNEQRRYQLVEEPAEAAANKEYVEIEQEHVGKWVTLILDSKGHHFVFTDKGRIV